MKSKTWKGGNDGSDQDDLKSVVRQVKQRQDTMRYRSRTIMIRRCRCSAALLMSVTLSSWASTQHVSVHGPRHIRNCQDEPKRGNDVRTLNRKERSGRRLSTSPLPAHATLQLSPTGTTPPGFVPGVQSWWARDHKIQFLHWTV